MATAWHSDTILIDHLFIAFVVPPHSIVVKCVTNIVELVVSSSYAYRGFKTWAVTLCETLPYVCCRNSLALLCYLLISLFFKPSIHVSLNAATPFFTACVHLQ